MVNGLVYGTAVFAARGSVWPAVLAHGGANTIGILTLYAGW
jgi:membrane protease YdiL (CAAX protease family)